MKKVILFFVLINLIITTLWAKKNDALPLSKVKNSFGVGFGLDYGGFGMNYTGYSSKNVGLFGAVGYTPSGLGYNVGAKLRYLFENPQAKSSPFLVGMYGYNRGFIYKSMKWANELEFGFSVGVGVDYRTSIIKQNLCSITIFYPIKRNETVNQPSDFFPIDISFGFKLCIDKYITKKNYKKEEDNL